MCGKILGTAPKAHPPALSVWTSARRRHTQANRRPHRTLLVLSRGSLRPTLPSTRRWTPRLSVASPANSKRCTSEYRKKASTIVACRSTGRRWSGTPSSSPASPSPCRMAGMPRRPACSGSSGSRSCLRPTTPVTGASHTTSRPTRSLASSSAICAAVCPLAGGRAVTTCTTSSRTIP